MAAPLPLPGLERPAAPPRPTPPRASPRPPALRRRPRPSPPPYPPPPPPCRPPQRSRRSAPCPSATGTASPPRRAAATRRPAPARSRGGAIGRLNSRSAAPRRRARSGRRRRRRDTPPARAPRSLLAWRPGPPSCARHRTLAHPCHPHPAAPSPAPLYSLVPPHPPCTAPHPSCTAPTPPCTAPQTPLCRPLTPYCTAPNPPVPQAYLEAEEAHRRKLLKAIGPHRRGALAVARAVAMLRERSKSEVAQLLAATLTLPTQHCGWARPARARARPGRGRARRLAGLPQAFAPCRRPGVDDSAGKGPSVAWPTNPGVPTSSLRPDANAKHP